jgi:Fe-S cluster assembly iron-binding protein IscA
MLKLDKKTIADFETRKVQKIKVFFYNGGCSGTKVDIIEDNFEVDENLLKLPSSPLHMRGKVPDVVGTEGSFDIYVEKQDSEKFEFATITRLVKADHTGEAKPRYIYTNEAILDRCGCGTSFSFEKKKPKINLEKLKTLKIDIKK